MTDTAVTPLHLVFSPAGFAALAPLLEQVDPDTPTAGVVLLQDACYLLRDVEAQLPVHCYVLSEDAALRGIEITGTSAVESIDQTGLVNLCCRHLPLVSWA